MAARLVLVLTAATLTMAVGAAAGAEPADEADLPPITVTPQPNPLEDERQRQRDRLAENTPCLGCGPAQEANRRNIFRRVGEVISNLTGLPFEPPDPTPEQRQEARVANDWRAAERGTEMDAFR